jgi:hypothetical protein
MDCQGAIVALQQTIFLFICPAIDPCLAYLFDITINDGGQSAAREAPVGFLLRCDNKQGNVEKKSE